MSLLTLEAKLERTDSSTPWGFRMQGGKDFSSPLTIQRVNPGSLAAKCGLQTGDIILKIGNADTSSLRHKEAQNSIIAAGNRLDLLLQRLREKRLVNQNGGGAPVRGGGSYETFSAPTFNAGTFQNAGGYNPPQSFNAAPKPFGSQQPSPAPFKPAYDDGLSQRTQNLSLSPGAPQSSQNCHPPALQARSVSPAEDRSGPGPVPPSQVLGPSKPGMVKAIVSQRYNTPIGLYSDSEVMSQFQGQSKFLISPGEDGVGDNSGNLPPPPPPPPEPQPPLVEPPLPSPPPPIQHSENGGPVKYFPSETFKLVQETEKGSLGGEAEDKTAHSRSFLKLQKHLDSSGAPPPPAPFVAKPAAPAGGYQPIAAPAAPVSKPWTPAAAPAPAPPPGPRPFGGGAPPKPTGVGAKRGRVGEAVVSNPGTGRIPVCSSCGTPIRGPFVTALGNCWCPDHFVCANPQCGVKLIDIGFVEEGGHLYCERDYEKYMAPHCKKCNNAIIGECVNALQATWHPECFLCTHCKQPIGGNQFHIEDGKPYCEKDWAAMFQTMCAGCDFPIEPGDRWVEAMSKNFHAECFNCSTCQVSLEGQPFVAKAGKAFCKKHAR